MKLGLRLFFGFWLLGFTFEAINALGQNFQHPGIFHGHLWDGPIKIGWITACFLASVPLISMLVRLLFTGELDGNVFEESASPGMLILYGIGLATAILSPFQELLNTIGPVVKTVVNGTVGISIVCMWLGFTAARHSIVLWENRKPESPVISNSKITVVQEQISLPL